MVSSNAGSNERWNVTVKTLHWSLALVLLIEVPVGIVMSTTYGPSFQDARVLGLHDLASQIHHTLGFLILLAALAWVATRLRKPRPAWDAAISGAQRASARAVHLGLLFLLVAVPLAGWLALSALADSPQYGITHRWFFGMDQWIPRIWAPRPFDDPNGYALFARAHIWGLWTGLGLFCVHVLGALWHHFIARDRVLRRMWPLGGD
jgi:cytochrome b561